MPKPYQPPPIDWHQQPLLRASTVAKILDTDPETVRNMIKDGRLEGVELSHLNGSRRHQSRYRVVTASLLKQLTKKVQAHV